MLGISKEGLIEWSQWAAASWKSGLLSAAIIAGAIGLAYALSARLREMMTRSLMVVACIFLAGVSGAMNGATAGGMMPLGSPATAVAAGALMLVFIFLPFLGAVMAWIDNPIARYPVRWAMHGVSFVATAIAIFALLTLGDITAKERTDNNAVLEDDRAIAEETLEMKRKAYDDLIEQANGYKARRNEAKAELDAVEDEQVTKSRMAGMQAELAAAQARLPKLETRLADLDAWFRCERFGPAPCVGFEGRKVGNAKMTGPGKRTEEITGAARQVRKDIAEAERIIETNDPLIQAYVASLELRQKELEAEIPKLEGQYEDTMVLARAKEAEVDQATNEHRSARPDTKRSDEERFTIAMSGLLVESTKGGWLEITERGVKRALAIILAAIIDGGAAMLPYALRTAPMAALGVSTRPDRLGVWYGLRVWAARNWFSEHNATKLRNRLLLPHTAGPREDRQGRVQRARWWPLWGSRATPAAFAADPSRDVDPPLEGFGRTPAWEQARINMAPQQALPSPQDEPGRGRSNPRNSLWKAQMSGKLGKATQQLNREKQARIAAEAKLRALEMAAGSGPNTPAKKELKRDKKRGAGS